MAFPFILATVLSFTGTESTIQFSISHYYYTGMRNVFVGILFAIAFFLYCYPGYDRRDNIAGNLACVFALLVALCPTNPTQADHGFLGTVHNISAASLFSILTYFSLCLFTRTGDKDKMTREKRKRNRLYKINGYIMITCVFLIGFYLIFLRGRTTLDDLCPVFWLESVALLAFGLSWLVKGEVFIKDRPKF